MHAPQVVAVGPAFWQRDLYFLAIDFGNSDAMGAVKWKRNPHQTIEGFGVSGARVGEGFVCPLSYPRVHGAMFVNSTPAPLSAPAMSGLKY
jgi:hypothetical protein